MPKAISIGSAKSRGLAYWPGSFGGDHRIPGVNPVQTSFDGFPETTLGQIIANCLKGGTRNLPFLFPGGILLKKSKNKGKF